VSDSLPPPPGKKKWPLALALVLLILAVVVYMMVFSSSHGGSGNSGRGTAASSVVPADVSVGSRVPEKGDIVKFGRYEQDNDLSNDEPIEWIVLDVDEANGKVLLISRYGLDAQPYNTTYASVTWENCTLRTWLNEDFLNAAFSEGERAGILTTTVDNSKKQRFSRWDTRGGGNTEDRVFLLSYAEANRYLSVKYWKEDDGNNTKSRVAPTDYAIETGAYSTDNYQTADGKPAGWWWLRMPGLSNFDAPYVHNGGSLYYEAVFRDYGVVRPAFWLNLYAADEKDGDTTVKIHGIVYYNTKKVIPVEPEESAIVNEELPINGSMTDKKITAYAFINDEQSDDILVCLIDGEWYQFLATERVGQP
jgi:hypothetical protein